MSNEYNLLMSSTQQKLLNFNMREHSCQKNLNLFHSQLFLNDLKLNSNSAPVFDYCNL